jgi:hypothetical protein
MAWDLAALLVLGIVQLSLIVFSLMLYAKSTTFGGLFPLGGSGRAFRPQPENNGVAGTKASKARMHMFTMAFFIKLPVLMI